MEPQPLSEHSVAQLETALQTRRDRARAAELRVLARVHDDDPEAAVRTFCERRLERQYHDTSTFLPPLADLTFH